MHIVRGAVASCTPIIAPAYPSVSLYRYTIQAARAKYIAVHCQATHK